MRQACANVVAGLLAIAATMSAGVGQAAEADGDLWIVNAAGRPVSVILDGVDVGEVGNLNHVRRPLSAGGHGLAVIAQGRVVSVWQDFSALNVSLDARGRPAWCYLAAAGGAPVRLEFLAPDQCRRLIAAGPARDVADLQPPGR